MTEFWHQLDCFHNYGLRDLQALTERREIWSGIERSAKLSVGVLETRRCLVTLPVGSATSPTPQEIVDLCGLMRVPVGLPDRIIRYLPSAAFVHFGFEYSGEQFIGKCYLELPSEDAVLGHDSGRLQFLGFKWSDGPSAMAVVTRYRSIALATWPDVMEKMLSVTDESMRAPMRSLLRLLQPDDDAQAVRLLEIEEEGSDRRSYDLNVYDRQYTLSCLAQFLPHAAAAYQLPSDTLTRWLHSSESETLGHIATGFGRDQRSFVTIYFGAQPFIRA